MAGITGLGTTYVLPNYTGILYALTPSDTPFFSAIGGLSGGGQSTSTQFEWQTSDLRAAGQNVALEGADAPTAVERVRGNVTNVTQIQQSQVAVSYTKLAAVGQKAGLNNDLPNPVTDELDWQVAQELKGMVRDIEYSFLRGAYVLPTDNNSARQTRGLLAAITTNVSDYGTTVAADFTATATTDVLTKASHGIANGTAILLTTITGGTGLAVNTVYYVRDTATNTIKVALTPGGPAVDITADGTSITVVTATPITVAIANALAQQVYDSGGILEAGTAAFIVPSHLKTSISKAYADAYGKFVETSRTVGGVSVDTLITDFGTLNLMVDRHMPKGTIALVSLEQCMPVYLEIPGKGHFFAEPLAKTGAAEKVHLYGEVGLAYGNEKAHGKLTNVA